MMKLFLRDPDQGAKFLSMMGALLSDKDLLDLARGGGFLDPNSFDFKRILECLEHNRFPVGDYFEFGWTVNECGVEYLWSLDPAVRIFASSIYLYCRRSLVFDGNYEPAYYYMMLKSALERRDVFPQDLVPGFLEWLHDFVNPDGDIQSYWLLLTWVVFAVCAGSFVDERFEAVVKYLCDMNLSRSDIDSINDCVFPRSEDWLILIDQYAAGSDFCSENLIKLICGLDY